MKNQIENIKRNYKNESKKAAFVILGFLSGQALAKGFDWLAGKFPQIEPYVRYGKPTVIGLGGWLLSSATNDKQTEFKFIGYGLQASGAYEGVKLIPIAKNFLAGIDPDISSRYYMENGKAFPELGEFGINALPVKSIEIEAAPEVKLELPELDGADNPEILGNQNISGPQLGYDPERFEGLL